MLSEEQRNSLFATIGTAADFLGWAVRVVSPQDISSSMLRRHKYNLNALSHDTAIDLIRRVMSQGGNVKEIYVDTVGPAETYRRKLADLFPDTKVTVCPRADSLFPIVSAASICAKVTRDRALRSWCFAERPVVAFSRRFGCGYPSDPTTQRWLCGALDAVFGFPGIVRFSWSTCKSLLDKRAYAVTWEDEEDEEDEAAAAEDVDPRRMKGNGGHDGRDRHAGSAQRGAAAARRSRRAVVSAVAANERRGVGDRPQHRFFTERRLFVVDRL